MKQVACVALITGSLLLSQVSAFASESDAAEIEETYNSWLQATNAKDIERWSSYLAKEALFVPPGVQPLETKEAILDYYRAAFDDPHFSLDCQQTLLEFSASGEMAWARGDCRATFSNDGGEKANGKSRWLKIWIRQDDGSWKCRVNTWNYEDGA